MIAAKAGVDSVDLLETVGEPRRRQFIWSEPSAEIGECSRDRRKSGTDQRESCQRARLAEGRPLGSGWCFNAVRHLPLLEFSPLFSVCCDRRLGHLPGIDDAIKFRRADRAELQR